MLHDTCAGIHIMYVLMQRTIIIPSCSNQKQEFYRLFTLTLLNIFVTLFSKATRRCFLFLKQIPLNNMLEAASQLEKRSFLIHVRKNGSFCLIHSHRPVGFFPHCGCTPRFLNVIQQSNSFNYSHNFEQNLRFTIFCNPVIFFFNNCIDDMILPFTKTAILG